MILFRKGQVKGIPVSWKTSSEGNLHQLNTPFFSEKKVHQKWVVHHDLSAYGCHTAPKTWASWGGMFLVHAFHAWDGLDLYDTSFQLLIVGLCRCQLTLTKWCETCLLVQFDMKQSGQSHHPSVWNHRCHVQIEALAKALRMFPEIPYHFTSFQFLVCCGWLDSQ